VFAIQSQRTSSRTSQDIVLSSSAYSSPERTQEMLQGGSRDFQRTFPALHLEASRDNSQNEEIPLASKRIYFKESIDDLTSSKHMDHLEGNNIEVRPGEYYRSIVPTKSETMSGEDQGAPQEKNSSTGPQHPLDLYNRSPQHVRFLSTPRQSRQEIPRIYSDHAPPPVLQTVSPGRQANPDIQDIITSIVNLLHGNVNVVANTARPLRPIQPTRINNRGPPRINDVPPLPPDFDTPGMNPPPPVDLPYPFEKPPAPDRPSVNQLPPERPVRPFLNGVPIPEQIIPQGNRPWNRPHRPGATRRPIPPYKPLPPMDSALFHEKEYPENQKHPEKPHSGSKPPSEPKPEVPSTEQDSGNKENIEGDSHHNVGTRLPEKEVTTASQTPEATKTSEEVPETMKTSEKRPEETTKKPQKYQPPLKENKVIPEDTLILGSTPQSFSIPNSGSGTSKPSQNKEQGLPKPATPSPGPAETKTKLKINEAQVEPSRPGGGAESDGHSNKPDVPEITPQTTSQTTKIISQITLNVETSSSVHVIEPTPSIGVHFQSTTEVNPTVVLLENQGTSKSTTATSIDLEPSKPAMDGSEKSTSIPTDVLSSGTSTSTKITTLPDSTVRQDLTSTVMKTKSTDRQLQLTLLRSRESRAKDKTKGIPVARYNFADIELTLRSGVHQCSQGAASARPEDYPYRPRPGIVLDDTLDYNGSQGLATHRPYPATRYPQIGDIFDVTVSAIQGPGGGTSESVRVPINPGGSDVILTSAVEGQGFVSIDGKRTYLNLFDNTDSTTEPTRPHIQPTRTHGPILGTGFAVAQPDAPAVPTHPTVPNRRPTFHRRPTQPPVRIDTCIVGDTSTCDSSQHEACATVQGVSACHCKPGYARLQHYLPCKKIISIVVSIRVDKIYERKIVWDRGLGDKDSESYQTLAYEANRAIESAMSMTPFSDEYMGSSINTVYHGDVSQGQGGVFVNATIKLTYEPRTARPALAGELQKHLLGVIHRRNNNIGKSVLYVDSPTGSISNLQDLDECASSELNDCHSSAACTNTWGGFTCTCNPGLKDPHKDDPTEAGRTCLSCPSSHCKNRGKCSYQGDQMYCTILKHEPFTEPMGPTRPNSGIYGYPQMNIHSTLPPVPLPRLKAPPRPRQRHQELDNSDSELQDKDRADLIPQNNGFHVPRPKSRSSVANQSGIYYDVDYDQSDSHHLSKNNIPLSTYSTSRPYYRT
ncbi:uncharacterized protein LOC105702468, partial [Orussus abietinus]|uniref:uncharacterized protein LOC105702468 n=1 Tax=Orussus abietinus TaxID=222816 RepID=UPI000C715AB8